MTRRELFLRQTFFRHDGISFSPAISAQEIESLAIGYSSLAGHHTPM